ncbi:hypothetical protein NC652_019167 [Populus alba x Populus x berolinensis]|nr:hypothetical protein NC652_019167 [Populus alba x Populus x berolinensis]
MRSHILERKSIPELAAFGDFEGNTLIGQILGRDWQLGFFIPSVIFFRLLWDFCDFFMAARDELRMCFLFFPLDYGVASGQHLRMEATEQFMKRAIAWFSIRSWGDAMKIPD